MHQVCQKLPGPMATSSPLHFLGGSQVPVRQLDIGDGRPQLFCVNGALVPLLIQRKVQGHFFRCRLARQVKQFQLHYQVKDLMQFFVPRFDRAHQMLHDLHELSATVYRALLARAHSPVLMKVLLQYERANL